MYELKSDLERLQDRVTACRKCPRLTAWREQVAREKRRAFANETYWGRPVPGFGDPKATLLIAGLAPAAHGANRTGRMFTGDRSGDWLYRALFKAGFANQPDSVSISDGLQLNDAFITAVVRCAPPANKPTPEERNLCVAYLVDELALLRSVKVIVCLGSFAWKGMLRVLNELGHPQRPQPRFAHLAEAQVGGYSLLGSYHPSQQNTFTGRLTEAMLDAVFERSLQIIRTVE